MNQSEGNQKKWSTKKIVIITLIVMVIMIIIGSMGKTDDTENTSTPSPTVTPEIETEIPAEEEIITTPTAIPTKEPEITKVDEFSTELSAGHYISGVDFPSGKYTITAVKGSGNVSSSNMFSGGLNEIMSATKDDVSINEFNNAKLEKDVILSISGDLVISISCKEANIADLQKREANVTTEVELKSGNYIAGDDFEAGTYNVVAVSGSGNVHSSNMFDGGLNEIISADNNGLGIKEYRNVNLIKDTELTISGVTIKLVPSK